MSLFICPICGAPLVRQKHDYRCENGHCHDIAREGYTYLLPANRKHSKMPGDDAQMAAGRRAFLSRGYYAPLQRALCDLALELTPAAPDLLDAGCGEGYYTAAIAEALQAQGRDFRMAGIDISKPILRLAAKRTKAAELAVASVYHLPVGDGTVDFLLDCFSPLAIEEFHRVLRPGGVFVYVVPSQRHLWGLKEALYDAPYPNEVKRTPYEGFSYLRIVPVRDTVTLTSQADIQALFDMTPYRWKTPREGCERLASLETLTTEIAFDIHVFTRD